MNRPTAILADDEPLLRDELRDGLAALWPELVIVAEAEDGLEASEALRRHRPDILFLDIQMPGMTGLEVAAQASGKCHVVFVTAYGHFALAAFEHGAVDFLVKPLTGARLANSVARLKERVRAAAPLDLEQVLRALAAHAAPARSYLRWLTVGQGRSMQLVTCDEVCYFQADHKYTRVVTAIGEAWIGKTIRELSEELDPEDFLQIHRGTLVHVQAIAAIDRDLRGGLSVRLKQRSERLPVSASFAHRFKNM
jgi:DNA-binding LytR/AlgR family response regulator